VSYYSADEMARREIAEAQRNRRRLENGYTHRWTDEEDDLIRLEYRQTNASARQIAEKLGVTIGMVKHRCGMLGVCKRTGRPGRAWTVQEEKKLRSLIGRYALSTISNIMNRSVNSIKIYSQRMKLKRRKHIAWYTKKDACEILGVGHRRVQAYIDSGALKAGYHNGVRPHQDGMAMWHIEEGDLRDFIIKHCHEFNGRNVDLIQVVHLLRRSECQIEL
jgi:hypothetical protein